MTETSDQTEYELDPIATERSPLTVDFIRYWYNSDLEDGTDGESQLSIHHTQLQLFAMHSPDHFMAAYDTILESLNTAEALAKRSIAERSAT